MQRPYFILSDRLILAIILCSGLLTGFQALSGVLTPDSSTPNDQGASQTPIDQPAPLIKPQPLPALPPIHPDLLTSLDALVTKQTVKMDPYIPLIQEITIGIEQISLAKNLWYWLKKLKKKDIDQPYEWAGTISILWKGNAQLVGSLGYVSLKPPALNSNMYAYWTKGFYSGLGVSYVSHYNATNNVYAGLHYNSAYFTNHIIPKNTSIQVTSKDLTASWLEVVIGAESRLLEKVALYGGCTLHAGWLYNFSPFNQAKNYVIPGYGLNANKLNLGLNLYILYKFSFIERMVKLT